MEDEKRIKIKLAKVGLNLNLALFCFNLCIVIMGGGTLFYLAMVLHTIIATMHYRTLSKEVNDDKNS